MKRSETSRLSTIAADIWWICRKRYCIIYLVLFPGVSRREFVRLKAAAEKAGGWYERKAREIPASFAFETEKIARKFKREQFG